MNRIRLEAMALASTIPINDVLELFKRQSQFERVLERIRHVRLTVYTLRLRLV